ncbi:MAG: hypothetical protein ACOCP4_07405 [Candidatus Woesearchaeota archaeon]
MYGDLRRRLIEMNKGTEFDHMFSDKIVKDKESLIGFNHGVEINSENLEEAVLKLNKIPSGDLLMVSQPSNCSYFDIYHTRGNIQLLGNNIEVELIDPTYIQFQVLRYLPVYGDDFNHPFLKGHEKVQIGDLKTSKGVAETPEGFEGVRFAPALQKVDRRHVEIKETDRTRAFLTMSVICCAGYLGQSETSPEPRYVFRGQQVIDQLQEWGALEHPVIQKWQGEWQNVDFEVQRSLCQYIQNGGTMSGVSYEQLIEDDPRAFVLK